MKKTNTYKIVLGGYHGHSVTQIAETPSKAKYQMYLEYIDCYENFMNFIQNVESCKLIHRFHVKDLFGDIDNFNRMKELRNIKFADIGMKVILKSQNRGNLEGVICGSNSSLNLDICFKGTSYTENCHPWWNIIYLDNKGNVIKEYSE